MADPESWLRTNEAHLAAATEWVRLRLVRLAFVAQEQPEAKLVELDEAIEEVRLAMLSAAGAKPAPALIRLSHLLNLSHHETNTLLLCVAMELDTSIASLCAEAQNNPTLSFPTYALSMRMFDSPTWDVLSADRPLRYWQIIEVNQRNAQPLTTSLLKVDERIVNYLKGTNSIDDRLMPFLIPLENIESDSALPPSQQDIVTAIINQLGQLASRHSLPVIQLLGHDRDNKKLIAGHVSKKLGVTCYHLSARLLPNSLSEIEELSRLWQRESILLPVALYLDTHDIDESDTNSADSVGPLMNRFLSRSRGLFFLDTRDLWMEINAKSIVFDIAKPTPAEQGDAWSLALNGIDTKLSKLLAAQFNLSIPEIKDISQTVLSKSNIEKDDLLDSLWQECLVHTRPQLDLLAQRITPKATWADIVLPDDQLNLLREIADQVRQRATVYEEWGFRQKLNRGLGIMALFAGESGTGKTMSAEIIANDLNLNLYRIDLSGVVSKYIGETEKNLRRLFDAAEDGGAILFFDEADALFGKRSQVKDSHDRYANIEINYLLQRMEAYQGLAILSTNQRSNLDDAFVRRLRFIVTFPFPDEEDRCRIWSNIFPKTAPTLGLDFQHLAQFKLTGGSINNIALNAAFLAARDDSPIRMTHMLKATRSEFLKMDRLINEQKFFWDETH